MTVYHVYPEGFSKLTFDNQKKALTEVSDLIDHSDPGDVVCMEIGEMTQEEYDGLGEFQEY